MVLQVVIVEDSPEVVCVSNHPWPTSLRDSFASFTYEEDVCHDTTQFVTFFPLQPRYHNLMPFASSRSWVGVVNRRGILFDMRVCSCLQ
mmetsp:Transcript_15963/g.28790  ORF Transcript_15963/g.28790 Transcript_15963/m.28790 type:complete len:89 (-) Transcript_15963:914-1180(-)